MIKIISVRDYFVETNMTIDECVLNNLICCYLLSNELETNRFCIISL